MNENLLTTLTEISEGHTKKIEQHGEQLSALQETLHHLTDWKAMLNQLTESDNHLNKLLTELPKQTKQHQHLNGILQETIAVLTRPQEQRHHHHFPKIAWATGGLFLILCLIVTGWYTTASRLDNYRDNDTKYRYLQLFGNSQMNRLLHYADSLQQARPNFFRDSILAAEKAKQHRLEMLDEATRKEAEAWQLRQKAKQ
ncbi:hypothetical protein SAMN04488128_1021024 [Chitinophaga eiseniae]|uniref:Uncharacterized protein n=1 Tax=Chitinophaga eiseniae TaxID=634771 RepID=A0A1T4RCH7_9BACT|nr:hypothetical protein [Chitinophaga eiseniae]SKA13609.1 hypothetical protein SAMN04488128_1021024 [Chitinophaga eiseniae]